MFKLTGQRLADMAYKAKGHLHGAYNQAVKWGGHIDNLMNTAKIAHSILAPHMGSQTSGALRGGLSKYEQVRDAVRTKHDTALGVAADIKTKALPNLGI